MGPLELPPQPAIAIFILLPGKAEVQLPSHALEILVVCNQHLFPSGWYIFRIIIACVIRIFGNHYYCASLLHSNICVQLILEQRVFVGHLYMDFSQ